MYCWVLGEISKFIYAAFLCGVNIGFEKGILGLWGREFFIKNPDFTN